MKCFRAPDAPRSRHRARLADRIVPILFGCLLAWAAAPAIHAEEDDPELERVFAHLEFLHGAWTGNGFEGKTDEVWLPPRDGQMMGIFRLVGGTMPRFSEILAIGRFEGRIELRIKHFDAELKGWEEKDDVVSFPFESSEPGRVVFRGLVFEDAGEDQLRIELQLRNAERAWTEVFDFKRR